MSKKFKKSRVDTLYELKRAYILINSLTWMLEDVISEATDHIRCPLQTTQDWDTCPHVTCEECLIETATSYTPNIEISPSPAVIKYLKGKS